MVLSYLLLGESLKLYKAVCGVLLYLGVTCVVQPTFLFGDSLSPEVELELNSTQYLNLTTTNTSLAEQDSPDLTGKSYSLGVIFGLIGAASRAGNYVTCKIIFEKKKKSTNWIILFAGFGGFLVSLASSFMDPEHLLLSDRIGEISANNWTGGVSLISTFQIISNSTTKESC